MKDMETTVSYIEGVEGNSFYIGDLRIAGPKPWGGGVIVEERKSSVKDILYALNKIYSPSHQPLKTDTEEAKLLLNFISNYHEAHDQKEL